jgi:ATP-dependent DNA ligase
MRSAYLAGRDPRPLPLVERKAILEKLIATAGSGKPVFRWL